MTPTKPVKPAGKQSGNTERDGASRVSTRAAAKPTSSPAKHKKAKLGQNFLVDPSAAQRIVDALGDVSGRKVIEIGPGKGAITSLLAARAGKLIAIEFDRLLATQLRFEYSRKPSVEIIEADVLRVDFDTLVQGELHGTTDRQPHFEGRRAKVVGNLPYYITSDILLRLFEFHRNFDEIVIMVQREVAERIAAHPGSRDFGLLSATTQLFTDAELLFTLPPGAFMPPPKVHSSVVRLRVAPKAESLQVEAPKFIEFLKMVFGQKRKTLANNLKGNYEPARIAEELKKNKVAPTARAEELSLAKLAGVFRGLTQIC